MFPLTVQVGCINVERSGSGQRPFHPCGSSPGSGWSITGFPTEFGGPEISAGSGCPGFSAGSGGPGFSAGSAASTSFSSSPMCCVAIYYLNEATHTLPLLSM